MIKEQLVSIVVITYNSEKFVIETLESIKNQSYNNIELVVSDDCSKDGTLTLCREWLEKEKSNFKNCILLESEKNQGIARNLNRGLKEARGQWIKPIAGDDILKENCITDNLDYAKKNPDSKIIFSKATKFTSNNGVKKYIGEIPDRVNDFFLKTSQKQYETLLFEGCSYTVAPTVFIKKELLKEIGYFSEKYEIEDYPTWLEITKLGMNLDYIDKVTVLYRIHENSVSNNLNCIFNIKISEIDEKIYVEFSKNIKVPFLLMIKKWLVFKGQKLTIENGNMKIHLISRILFFVARPVYTVKRLIKRILTW